jgi:nucleotide-binding universal stress UspA family protein
MIDSMDTIAQRMTSGSTAIDRSRPGPVARDADGVGGQLVGIRRLLLATDLSSASERAADEAIVLAVESGAQLLVLSVIDPRRLRLPGGLFLRRIDQERSLVEAGLHRLVNRARADGARATFLVWEGDPAEAILAASEAESVDVILLGSHGRGRLGRLVLGSVSTRVSEEASCEVLVVGSTASVV